MIKSIIALCLVASMAWGGMEFTTANTEVVIGSEASLFTQDVTYSCWTTFDSLTAAVGNLQGLMSSSGNNDWNGILLLLNETTAKMGFSIGTANATASFVTVLSNTVMVTNRVYHIVGTYGQSDDTARLYIDGVLQADTKTVAQVTYVNSIMRLGQYGAGGSDYNLRGTIASSQVWTRALTDPQVLQLYQSGGKQYPSDGTNVIPPVAEWYGATGYGDGQTLTNGTVITDHSGNGLNGFATNGVKQVSVQVSTNALGFTTPIPVQRIKRRK